MEELKMLLQYEDIQTIDSLIENMNSVLKDSDAEEEKKLVKNFMKKFADTFQFVVIGDSGTGKTTLLKRVFGEAVFYEEEDAPTVGIHEFRYGEENAEFRLDEDRVRIFRPIETLRGISVIDTQGCDEIKNPSVQEKIKQCIERSDVLMVVFSAENTGSYAVWDLLEGVETRKVICILTKTDLTSTDILEKNEIKIRRYMMEAGIKSPVFRMSISKSKANNIIEESEEYGIQKLSNYINRTVIVQNPGLKKRRENVLELKAMLNSISHSFLLRKKQYEADVEVLEKINTLMDCFFLESRDLIDMVKTNLQSEITIAIDSYENEIISKLDPKQIKERFPNGYTDFMNYLNFINESYRKKMTDNVNSKTQGAVRAYLSQLELVLNEAIGYFCNRQSILKLEDHFYGSIARSKQQVICRLENNLQETREYYGSLLSASEELFLKIWKERGKIEQKVKITELIGGVAGAGAGMGGLYGAAALFHVGTMGVLWPVVAAVAGSVLLANMAKKIMFAKTMDDLEKKVQEAVTEFRMEVARTKKEMTAQILETVESIFQRERDSADKIFLDFRMSVNIDGRNIPILEEKVDKIDMLMRKIEEIEGERTLQ